MSIVLKDLKEKISKTKSIFEYKKLKSKFTMLQEMQN